MGSFNCNDPSTHCIYRHISKKPFKKKGSIHKTLYTYSCLLASTRTPFFTCQLGGRRENNLSTAQQEENITRGEVTKVFCQGCSERDERTNAREYDMINPASTTAQLRCPAAMCSTRQDLKTDLIPFLLFKAIFFRFFQ